MRRIFNFLADVAAHNDREWFAAHRAAYDEAQALFAEKVGELIGMLARFDETVAHVEVKQTLYRFYRDTRFSPDKSPYKRHFGAYINARGKKSIHGGYYLHLQPGNSMVAGGDYCLPGPVMKAVRRSIVEQPDAYRAILERAEFKALFPVVGSESLKVRPAGFPADFPYPELLKPKDFSVAHALPDNFFTDSSDWTQQVAEMFRTMKPFLDFINETVDDFL